jgi:hypothetical protein
MKNLSYVIVLALLLQSCQTLKPVSMNEAEIGKNYILKLKKGTNVRGKLEKVMNDTLVFEINHIPIKIPKNSLAGIKREKLKKKTVIIGSALTVLGIIIFFSSIPDKKPEKPYIN